MACKSRIDTFVETLICEEEKNPDKSLSLAVKFYKPKEIFPVYQKIPRTIIQTNEKDLIPKDMARSNLSIILKNPEYEYIYFDNERARNYLIENFPPRIISAYDKLKPGAYKADLFRYCYLYKNGGVYVDTGMVAVNRLKDIIKSSDEFISPEDNGTGGLYNAFICCTPQHPIVETAMLASLKNIEEEKYGEEPLDITGPTLFARSFKTIVDKDVKANGVYPTGIRVIEYKRFGICNTAGQIWDGDLELFITRYPNYHIDRKWYNKNKHYSDMWREKNVFITEKEKILKEHQEDLTMLFKKFINFAEKYGLVWWATGGTLLGAIREMNIIEWDDDIDIEVPSETLSFMDKKRDELHDEGMFLVLEDNIWRIKYPGMIKKAYIDLFEVHKKGEKWIYTNEENVKRWPNSYFLDKELFPLKTYKFGDIEIKGAHFATPYLERQYGDWKTPVKEKAHYDF